MNKLDLLTLKMAVVTNDETALDCVRRAAGAAPVPVEVTIFGFGETVPARDLLARGVDMLFLDCDLAPDVRGALIATARAAKESMFVIQISSPNAGSLSGTEDADAVLEKPVDAAKACAVVERCVRAGLPNRVLVVDDSPTVRAIVRKMMRASRFSLQTEETGEGAAALALMHSGRFDIVFLDCNMPGLDGFATLSEISRNHPRIATVMMTGTQDQSIAARARAAGAKDFLFKPFFPKDIDAVLHGLFGLNVPPAARA
jgi:CheY-like chemotaxis protein